jgi:hypothetical protein
MPSHRKRLGALLHHKPAALLLVEVERSHGHGHGRHTARGFDKAEELSTLSDEGCAPATAAGGIGLLLTDTRARERDGMGR